MSKSTLGYWKIKGLASGIRLILHYAEEDYNEVIYEFGTEPETLRKKWLSEKFTLGLDFPNLPYYIDGDVKLTQSNAIMQYLGSKHKLNGKTPKEEAIVTMLQGEIYDIRMAIARAVYNPEYEKLRPDLIEALKTKLKTVDAFLGGKKFLLGDEVTVADFNLWDVLDNISVFEPDLVESYPNLKNFKHTVENEPKVAAYLNSSDYIDWPINGLTAVWGGSGTRPKA